MASPKIALLGTGIMGSGMAGNLLKAGFPLTVWNRTAAKAQPLVAVGAVLATSPAEAAAGADIIFSVVGDDDSSRPVWLGPEGALAGATNPHAICIECTTISLGWARELADAVTRAGLRFIDCPLTGGRTGAEAGTLTLLVGAEESVLAEARPALNAISSKIIVFGPPGAGTGFKLLYNLMGATQMVAMAEALLTAEKLGLNMESVIEGLTTGFTASPGVKNFVRRMVDHDHDFVNFSAHWMRKDAAYAVRQAAEVGQAVPLSGVSAQIYQLAVSHGLGHKNLSAVIEALKD